MVRKKEEIMTHKTLEKLAASSPAAKAYLDYLRKCLKRARANEDRMSETERKYEIRGAIAMLQRTEIITERERQILHCYYTL